MEKSKRRGFEVCFFLVSVSLSGLFAWISFFSIDAFAKVAPSILDVLAIVCGVSLAALGLFVAPVRSVARGVSSSDEAQRFSEIIKRDDVVFSRGIVIVFCSQIFSVLCLLVFLLVFEASVEKQATLLRLFGAVTAFSSVLGVVAAVRLPLLFLAIAARNRDLE